MALPAGGREVLKDQVGGGRAPDACFGRTRQPPRSQRDRRTLLAFAPRVTTGPCPPLQAAYSLGHLALHLGCLHDHAPKTTVMTAPRNVAWLAASLLLSLPCVAAPPRAVVPETPAAPMLLDGRLDRDEWAGALEIPVADGLRLLLKQSQGHVHLAVDTPGSTSQPMDLYVLPADSRLTQLHASMQIAERHPTRESPEPAWRWGHHVDWLASELKLDSERPAQAAFAERLFPADGTEFQIIRHKFPGSAWRVRLTIDEIPGGAGAFVYPTGSTADDPGTWAIWELERPVARATSLRIPSTDGLVIDADEYPVDDPTAPIVLLCHRAGWSRGEYASTAAWFNALGLHAIAIDQRAGGEVNGVTNSVHAAARKKGLPTEFVDAKADIEAALAYVVERYPGRPLLLMGSSYSSALALRIAGENRFPLAGVISFAPGEYFGRTDYISEVADRIRVPVFITSARHEQSRWDPIAQRIPAGLVHRYLPETTGLHGSQALWDSTPGHAATARLSPSSLQGSATRVSPTCNRPTRRPAPIGSERQDGS